MKPRRLWGGDGGGDGGRGDGGGGECVGGDGCVAPGSRGDHGALRGPPVCMVFIGCAPPFCVCRYAIVIYVGASWIMVMIIFGTGRVKGNLDAKHLTTPSTMLALGCYVANTCIVLFKAVRLAITVPFVQAPIDRPPLVLEPPSVCYK